MLARADLRVTALRSLLLVSAAVFAGWMLGAGRHQAVTAQASPTRIAVIDVQKVLTLSNPGKAAFAKLKSLQDERVARARLLETELANLDAEIKKPTTPPAQRNNLAKQIEDKQITIKRFAEDADRDLNLARQREMGALEGRIQPVVEAIGKEMALAGIFNKFESGLIYAAPAVDITDTVIARFNAAPAPVPAASPRP